MDDRSAISESDATVDARSLRRFNASRFDHTDAGLHSSRRYECTNVRDRQITGYDPAGFRRRRVERGMGGGNGHRYVP